MNYSLTWKVSKTIPTACPDHKPDPYTGEYPSYHCAVYHCETKTEEKGKNFDTRKEAVEFASKAPSSCFDFLLNGKPLKDKRKNLGTPTLTIADGTALTSGGTILLAPNT